MTTPISIDHVHVLIDIFKTEILNIYIFSGFFIFFTSVFSSLYFITTTYKIIYRVYLYKKIREEAMQEFLRKNPADNGGARMGPMWRLLHKNDNSLWHQLSAPFKTQHVLNQVSAPLEDDTLQDLIQATFTYKYTFMIKEEGTSDFIL